MTRPANNTNPSAKPSLLAARFARARAAARSVLLPATLALAVLGCEEKKAPPPPPPPPAPPPPPPPISFQSLTQEMKVDARVQVASGLAVSDESFARAALELTNAIAKGDADALSKKISPRAAAVLAELKGNEQWAKSTKGLEAVRIVTLGTPTASADPAAALTAAFNSEDRQILENYTAALTRGLSPEEQVLRKSMLQKQFRERAQALAAQGQTEEASRVEAAALAVTQIEQLISMSATGFNANAEQAMLLALQDQKGAYLWGWQASRIGDGWQFDLAPARDEVRPRASQFDGIGMAGFAPPPPSNLPTISPPAAPGSSPPSNPAPPSGGGGGSGGGG